MGRASGSKHHGLLAPPSRHRGRYGGLTIGAAVGDTAERVCPIHGLTRYILYGTTTKRWRCIKCDRSHTVQGRKLRRNQIVTECGGKCQRCGYDHCFNALQFHHRDPAAKTIALSMTAFSKPLEILRAEARKCDLLCGNCHAELEGKIAAAKTRERTLAPLIEFPDRLYGECRRHGRCEFMRKPSEGYLRCKKCRREENTAARRAKKAQLVKEAGSKCIDCGYDQCLGALHFHHRDPATKQFGLGRAGDLSLERQREEALKCDLLCSNCHAERHADDSAEDRLLTQLQNNHRGVA
jgi:hypothetical protein